MCVKKNWDLLAACANFNTETEKRVAVRIIFKACGAAAGQATLWYLENELPLLQ